MWFEDGITYQISLKVITDSNTCGSMMQIGTIAPPHPLTASPLMPPTRLDIFHMQRLNGNRDIRKTDVLTPRSPEGA